MTIRSARTSEDIEHWYYCGRCGNEQYAIISAKLPVPCIDCDWPHRERKPSDVPETVKMDLTQY